MVTRDPKKAVADADRPTRVVDVAKLAKVSRATAARALGGYGFVGSDVRERVSAAARELDYRGNEIARAMRAGKTRTIGVVVADIGNSFFGPAVRAIIDRAAASGYQALIINTDDDPAKEVAAVRVLIDKRVDGLIVVPSSQRDFRHLVFKGDPSKPIVLLDRRVRGLDLAAIVTDDHRSAGEAIDLFVARGHRLIAMLAATAAAQGKTGHQPLEVVSTVEARVSGASLALSAAGLGFPEGWLIYSHSKVDDVRERALKLLSGPVRPTAMLATNEEMALGFIAACKELKLAVGRDISLISFDDSPWARVFDPAISVIERPVRSLGEAAVESLIGELENGVRAVARTLPNRLVDRQSVGTAKTGRRGSERAP